MPRLVIIDTSAIIHRAYHALPPLTDKQGRQVGAIYGLTSILLKIFRDLKPDYFVAALDRPEPSFRKKLSNIYQVQRKETDPGLKEQFPIAAGMLDKFGIRSFSKASFEADDIIGSLCTKLKNEKDLEIIVVTGDLDISQLIDKNVHVMMMRRGITDTVIYDPEKFIEKYGFKPINLIDYKALKGDSSDNIKGVPRVGEKAAEELIKRFVTIESLYENLEKFAKENFDLDLIPDNAVALIEKDFGKKFCAEYQIKVPNYQIQSLIENKESAFLSKTLATIVNDVDFDIKLSSLNIKNKINKAKLREALTELNFQSVLNKLDDSLSSYFNDSKPDLFATPKDLVKIPAEQPQKGNYILLNTREKIEVFLKLFKEAKIYALDTEGTSVDTMQTRIIGLSFSFKQGEAYYLPVETSARQIVSIQGIENSSDLWDQVKTLLEDNTKKIVGHNIKYDYKVLKNYGVNLPAPYFDTMIAAFFIEGESRGLSLDDLSLKNFNYTKISIKTLLGKDKTKTLADAPVEQVAEYAAEDADFTWRLFELYTYGKPVSNIQSSLLPTEPLEEGVPRIKIDHQTQDIFHKIEMPLLPVLAEMERTGILIDADILREIGKKLNTRIDEAKKEIYELAEEKFNINSTKKLSEILFGKMGIGTQNIRKTSTGKISTSASELQKLITWSIADNKSNHPILKKILEYRECKKLISTYVEPLVELINPETGRVHTSYMQTITVTGRLSSTDPNLQNIPARTAIGEEIRKAFTVPGKNILISADYSQIELRLAAHMSEDPIMIRAFLEGKDFHTSTASMIFDLPEDQVTKQQRRIAKTINFGILYGLSSFGLSQQLGIGRNEAQEYIDRYFEKYKKLNFYLHLLVQRAQNQGFVETLLGRRRYITGIGNNQYRQRLRAERTAVNMPFQGTNADIIKIAMINIHKKIQAQNSVYKNLKMLLQVHDELVFECPENNFKESIAMIKQEMEGVIKLKVPLQVDVEVGKNWLELEKYADI